MAGAPRRRPHNAESLCITPAVLVLTDRDAPREKPPRNVLPFGGFSSGLVRQIPQSGPAILGLPFSLKLLERGRCVIRCHEDGPKTLRAI